MTTGRLCLLAPVDGSETSRLALDVAIDLAKSLDAKIVVCYVVNLTDVALLTGGEAQLLTQSLNEFETKAERTISDALTHIGSQVPASSRIVRGEPVYEITLLADQIQPEFHRNGKSRTNRIEPRRYWQRCRGRGSRRPGSGPDRSTPHRVR